MRYTSFLTAVFTTATLTVILSSCTPARKVDRYQYLLENRSPSDQEPIASSSERTQERPRRQDPPPRRRRSDRNNQNNQGIVYTHDRTSNEKENDKNVVVMHNDSKNQPRKKRPRRGRPNGSYRPRNLSVLDDQPSKVIEEREIYVERDTEQVLRTARSYMGVPYLYGGMSRNGMDCSALVCLSFSSVDKKLPRTSATQAQVGKTVSKRQLKPGHLVFFSTNFDNRINHVGIVTNVRNGDVEFIHASSSRGVRIDKLSGDYWRRRYVKAVAPMDG